jgi:hypothetical protein
MIKVVREQEVLQEALNILIQHLEPSKFSRFVAACQLGEGDYLKNKDQLFAQETVASLSEKIERYQNSLD